MKFSGVKKISAAAIAAMMLVAGMTACGSSDSTGTADSGATTGTDVKKIGIIQLVEHDSLDLAREGFIDGLAEAGYVDGQNIKIDYKMHKAIFQTVQPSPANLQMIIKIWYWQLPPKQHKLWQAKQRDTPILVTAVTDPADSGLVESNEAPGGNVTGTSDLTPVKGTNGIVNSALSGCQKVALLYCTSEANSKYQIDLAKKKLPNMGIEAIEKLFPMQMMCNLLYNLW